LKERCYGLLLLPCAHACCIAAGEGKTYCPTAREI
jgi:hypothetical protein